MHDEATGAGRQSVAGRGLGKLDLAEGGAKIERGGRVTSAFQRCIGKPGTFADAAGGREQAGDAKRTSAARICVRPRGEYAADIEQQLGARTLRQTLP